jgi:hypothetical protein
VSDAGEIGLHLPPDSVSKRITERLRRVLFAVLLPLA